MRGNLKDRIGRGVNDRLARLDVLCAQFFDDLRARSGNVAEDSRNAGLADEASDEGGGKSIRVRGKRMLENYSSHLPVARRRVFSVRAQSATSVRTSRITCRRHALKRADVSQTKALQVWQTHFARLENMPKRVRAGVAPLRRIRHRTDAGAIKNDQGDSVEVIVDCQLMAILPVEL